MLLLVISANIVSSIFFADMRMLVTAFEFVTGNLSTLERRRRIKYAEICGNQRLPFRTHDVERLMNAILVQESFSCHYLCSDCHADVENSLEPCAAADCISKK